jgi:hypothetical protein
MTVLIPSLRLPSDCYKAKYHIDLKELSALIASLYTLFLTYVYAYCKFLLS